jgi:hypothetical protein
MKPLYPRSESGTFASNPSNEGEPSVEVCVMTVVRKGMSDGR